MIEARTEDTYALVGAGPLGLAVARALKQHGVPYAQLEAADAVGGNWRDGVYQTAHIISSRKTTEFTDYPMPADYPDFPSAAQMLAYLQDYARHYELEPAIEFGVTVSEARPVVEGGTERWDLTLA
ncbi:MAG TPA: NAD(P)-binding protein, partial [Acidimicrobiia bacterium]